MQENDYEKTGLSRAASMPVIFGAAPSRSDTNGVVLSALVALCENRLLKIE